VYLKHAARPLSLQNLCFYCPAAQQDVASGDSFSPQPAGQAPHFSVQHRAVLYSHYAASRRVGSADSARLAVDDKVHIVRAAACVAGPGSRSAAQASALVRLRPVQRQVLALLAVNVCAPPFDSEEGEEWPLHWLKVHKRIRVGRAAAA
jgi:hypothetical protein